MNAPDQPHPQDRDRSASVAALQDRVNELERALADKSRFFDIALDLLCTADMATGHFVDLNPMWTKVTGYSFEELRSQPFLMFVHPDDRQATLDAAQSLGGGDDILRFVNRYRCKDGSYRWIEWISTPDLERNLIYAAARDITESKQIEDALREQNQMLMRQAEILREVSTPIIPLADNVIVVPLIGNIDSQRAQHIMEAVLNGVAIHQARTLIIDITGVSVVDTAVANALIQTARAASLLGAQIVLTGIQPSIAQTLVALGIDLSALTTRATLQDGIRLTMREGQLTGAR